MNSPETIAEVDGIINEHAEANDIEKVFANSPYMNLMKPALNKIDNMFSPNTRVYAPDGYVRIRKLKNQ